jgi:hypothetical protein
MTDLAHQRIATLVHDLAECLQPGRLPAVDHADLRVAFQDDGGRCAVGVGVAGGADRLEMAVALALRDLSQQIRRAQELPGDA